MPLRELETRLETLDSDLRTNCQAAYHNPEWLGKKGAAPVREYPGSVGDHRLRD